MSDEERFGVTALFSCVLLGIVSTFAILIMEVSKYDPPKIVKIALVTSVVSGIVAALAGCLAVIWLI